MPQQRPNLSTIMKDLEGTWEALDAVYGTLSPADWSRKFGKNWTYADQPYHLAYFDRFHAEAISRGADVPPEEQVVLNTMQKLNGWNAAHFAKQPAGQTYEESLRQMRESRDVVRRLVSGMTDEDLDANAWSALLGGWVPAYVLLQAVVIHNAGEYQKLWLRTGRKGPALSPEVVHLRLSLMMKFMALSLNRQAAESKRFTVVWNFEGPGGGVWTFQVAGGACMVTEAFADDPDLVITMKPETLQKLIARMEPPPLLMLKREMKVKGMRNMGTFSKLFPEPKPDQLLITGPQAFLD